MEKLDIKNEAQEIGVQEHVSKLSVNSEESPGLVAYCSVKVDGKEVRRFKSDSFLQGFASFLNGQLAGGRRWRLGLLTDRYFGDEEEYNFQYGNASDISGQTNQQPFRVTLAANNMIDHVFKDYTADRPNYVIICGASDMNGIYYGQKIDNTTLDLYDLDGNPIDGSAAGTVTDGKIIPVIGWAYDSANRIDYQRVTDGIDAGAFNGYFNQNWQVIVGSSNRAVSIDDVYLWDRVMPGSVDGTLNHGNRSVSPIVTDKPTSRFTISKPFTNEGATDITINEIGIVSGPGNSDTSNGSGQNAAAWGGLQVRDVLGSSLLVPSGSTLTVDYELVIRLDPDTQDTDTDGSNGGFLETFMQTLRSWAAQTSWSANLVQNYNVCAPAGKGSVNNQWLNSTTNVDLSELYLGIRLGDNNQFTSMTDQGLNIPTQGKNGIEHGSEDGQLYHYGCNVEEMVVDKVNGTATIEVSQIFENRGSTSITVREKGLWALDGDYSGNTPTSSMIARMALATADQFTINPGEFHQVKFIIEIAA